MMGRYIDLTSPKTCLDSCHECGEEFKDEGRIQLEIYDDPFATEPRIVAVHTENNDDYGTCLDKLTDTSWGDFRYFTCDHCGRLVARQCGFNGWRSYVKEVDGEEWCIKCYHEDRLRDGEPREKFEDGKIPGDFYSQVDLEDQGWKPVVSYHGFHIATDLSVKQLTGAALNLFDQGLKVLVDYGSMAYGGGEGYVSLYTKGGE
jgi:hypothetical protein